MVGSKAAKQLRVQLRRRRRHWIKINLVVIFPPATFTVL